ncbi:MAG: replicative DNA helicase [Rhodospirillaceae bacterium]|nr:replicative DNA helicase [Rhodospirillaceae bacterium]|tara:strand:- start:8774 stop:10300 length:1527 start_codon:yes stop_codon:yes gene_type:complete
MVTADITDLTTDDEAPAYRSMPHNEEAEQALLGAILVNNDVLNRVEDFLRGEHFYIPVHGRIYDAIQQVIEKAQIANPITLRALFESDEALAEVGGAGYLARLAASAATIINAAEYAKQIHEHFLRRELIAIGEDMVNEAFEHTVERDAESQIEEAEKQLFDLAETGNNSGDFRSFKEVAIEALGTMEAAYRNEAGMSGTATGLSDLDDQLGGLHRSDLIILAARPGMGKTSIVTNISFDIAKRYRSEVDQSGTASIADGGVVGIFSLEMSSEQLITRVLSEASGVPSDLLRRGNINQKDFEAIVRASQELSRIPLFIDDTPAISIQALRTRARRLKRQHGLSLVIVDYLQLVRPSGRSNNDSRVQEVSEVTQGLKALAKELDLPVIACSQLSRAVEQREDKRPLLSDLRESGSIEQDADIVMFLYREEYYQSRLQPQPKDGENDDSASFRERLEQWQQRMDRIRGITEVIVAKHRHGATGDVKLFFNAATTEYTDLEARYSQDDVPY